MAGDRLQEVPADAPIVLAASRTVCGRPFEAAMFLGRLAQVRADGPGLCKLKRAVHEALGQHRAAEACASAAALSGDA